MEHVKITKLTAENIKRLVAVEITPDGNIVQVGGDNEAGKSSVLDSIMYLMAGKRAICQKPLRTGADKGKIIANFSNGLVAKRTFTAGGGGSISVESADGATYKSPQAILDSMTNSLAFDPLQFMNGNPFETLKQLVGLDTSEIDKNYIKAYDSRRDLNREVKKQDALIGSMVGYPELEGGHLVSATVVEEIEKAMKHNGSNTEAHRKVQAAATNLRSAEEAVAEKEAELADAKMRLKNVETMAKEAGEGVVGLKDIEIEPLKKKLSGIEEHNRKVANNRELQAAKDELSSLKKEASSFDFVCKELEKKKQAMLAEAQFPIEGLSFDETGVTFNGEPFDQASSEQQLRVSVAMAAAMNPTLRVMLVRDGSLLDETNLKLLAEFAKEHDLQIWLEKVGDDGACSVVIEDGKVKGMEQKENDDGTRTDTRTS